MSKKFSVVLICFLIALVFWMLIALSHDYPTSLTFPVTYTNLPNAKVVLNELPSSVSLRVKTTGFNVLSYNFQKDKKPIEVDVSSILGNTVLINRDVIQIPTESFFKDFQRQLGSIVTIIGYEPDSIYFYLSDRIARKLPVHVNLELSFEQQYDSSGFIHFSPDSVVVSGPPSVVNELTIIQTEKISLTKIHSNVKTSVALPVNKLLNYNQKSVSIEIPVEKFTEGQADVPVHPINVDPGYSLKTFPDKVSVRYQVALSKYNLVHESDFDAVVNAKILSDQRPEKLSVQLMTSPSFVRALIIEPGNLDYIMRKK